MTELKNNGTSVAARQSHHAIAYPEYRALLVTNVASTIASYGFLLLIGHRIAEVFRDPLIFGWIGLTQAVPALGVALLGGYLADSRDRRKLLLLTLVIQFGCGLTIWHAMGKSGETMLYWIFPAMFFQGLARGLTNPATIALESELVPPIGAVSAATWGAGSWQASAVVGPLMGGLVAEQIGNQPTALILASMYIIGALALLRIKSRGAPIQIIRESIFVSISGGLKFVFARRILWASMALDLFAVFFGGAVAMLPLYAEKILHLDKSGTGFLMAVPLGGAFITSIFCAARPPRGRVGKLLLGSVFAFGVCMIIFGLSRNIYLASIALFLSGSFDGISVVIRRSILRLFSPNHMRGRLAAVNSIFIVASNELGEFESGTTAWLIGLVPSIIMGGVVTLCIVTIVALVSPEIRNLDFRDIQVPE